MLLDRLGGDPVSGEADLELVIAEEVGIIGGGKVGGEFADLAVDGLVNGSGQILDLGLLLGRQGCRGHGGLQCRGWILLRNHRHRPCVQKFHQLSRRSPR